MSVSGTIAADHPPRAARGSVPYLTTLADGLLLLSVLVLFTVSPNVLFALGIPYGMPGGSALAKLHPGTYVAVAALAARMLAVGPLTACAIMAGVFPATCAFAAGCLFAALYIVANLHQPVTAMETFLLPVIVFACVTLRGRAVPGLALMLHAVFLANALIGIGEFLAGHRLTPFVAGSVVLTTDWRSTALFGHPLVNAMLTAHYIAIMVFRPRRVAPAWRFGMIGLQMAALAVFGGRTAIVLVGLLLAGVGLAQVARVLAGQRISLRRLAIGIGCAAALAIALALVAEHGFFDLVADRFVDDAGSANARVVMFRVFDAVPLEGLIFGPDPQLVDGLMYREGVEFGIESFPLAITLLYGIVVASVLIAGLIAFFVDLVRATRPASVAVLILFLMIAISSTSLASKSTIVAMLAVMLLAFYAPPEGYLRRASRRSLTRASA